MSVIPDCDFLETNDADSQRTIAHLETQNRAIRQENDELREENRKLVEQVQALTALGNHSPHNQARDRGELEHEFLERRHW